MRTFIIAALAGSLTASFAAGAEQVAQGSSPGLAVARAWCSSCHIVEPGAKGSDAAPPFVAIANDPKRTRARIEAWLHDPHPPMPQLNLSRPDIAAISDYIESLKGK